MGDPALVSPDGMEQLLERRAAALLALAAIEPGVARRRVATLLWPDSAESHARQALRQQLLRLRKVCGGDLLEGESALRLAPHVTTDIATGAAARAALLGAFDYEDTDELAAWVQHHRERMQRKGAEQLERDLARTEAAGDLGEALTLAQQALAAQPDNEENHRRVMRLHYLRGDIAQAQAAYERLRTHLRREYEAAPSAQTQALARTVRSAAAPALAARPPTPASLLRPPRLVGRDLEWGALEDCAAARRAAVVLGVGGMGKTRLVSDFAATRGQTVLAGARPGDAFAAYSLLVRLVRLLAARAHYEFPGGLRGELARLLPELGKAPPLRESADRVRLAAALEALAEIALSRGLAMIVLDDLHHADDASLEAIQSLGTMGGRMPVVLAYRADEASPRCKALADSLVAAGMARTIELAPLDESQVRELIDSLGIEGIDGAALGSAISRHTGGNPLFVLETLKAMLAGESASPGRLPAAVNMTDLIARRVARLTPGAVSLARCAAVAGQDFSAELAAHVIGVRPLDLTDAWAELERAHVLRDGAFEHDLVHEAALASVPAAIARRLHAEIAAFLETVDIEPARVAAHWLAARRPREASSALMKAAARAKAAGRRIEEAGLLRDAAQCFQRCNDPDGRFEALIACAEALCTNDLGEGTLEAIHAALDAARTNDQKLRAMLRQADYHNQRSESEPTVREARAGMTLARKARRPDLVSAFCVVAAGGLCELRRVEEALETLEPFRAAPAPGTAPRERTEYLIQLGIALDLANRLSEALEAFEGARALAAEHGFKDVLATALSNLATTKSKRGELSRAVEFGRQALQLWRESEPLKGMPVQTQALLAHRLRDIGHYDEAVALLEDALAEFRRAGTRSWIFSAAHRLALAYAHLGQFARALQLLAEDPAGIPSKQQAMWLAHRAEVARLCGGAATKPVRSALALLGNEVDDGNNRLVSLFASSIVAPEEGEAIASAVAAWAQSRERFGMAIAAHARAAACALAQGAKDRAQPQVEAALRLFRDYEPDNFYRAELWWVACEVFRAAGRVDEARAMVLAGRDWIESIAREHVPEEYRDTFLRDNPVNRALLGVTLA